MLWAMRGSHGEIQLLMEAVTEGSWGRDELLPSH